MPDKKRWMKRELMRLLKEDKDGFYRLAVKYGLDAISPTGRLRRSNAVLLEIVAAYKEQGYKAVPRVKVEEEKPTTTKKKSSKKKISKKKASKKKASKKKASKKKAVKEAPKPTPKKKAVSKKASTKKKAAKGAFAGSPLTLFLGMASFVVAQEEAFLRTIKTAITDVGLTVCMDMAGMSIAQVKTLADDVFDADSELGNAAAHLGLSEDALLGMFLRFSEIAKE